jgi:hypothetical protein
MLKRYQKFLEEITIKGNIGVPGEGDDTTDPKYLSDVERRAKERLGIQRSTPQEGHRFGMELMRLLEESLRKTRGKEKELEQLALDVIMSEYASILDGVELDIKFIRPGGASQIMDPGTPAQPPMMRLTNDPELKMEVDKAKLLNNVIQGEAKNTKNILHTDIVKDGLNRIFGERESRVIFETWDRMSKLADKLDWMIPIEVKSQMMEMAPEGMAGAVKVEWNTKKEDKEEKEDLAQKILKDLEKGNDISDNEEDISDLLSETTPKIIARGVDFPMLLHETVKGIYELIAAHAIPDDAELAQKIKINVSSFADEAEDFRYGPEIAADLRDFVNSIIDEISKSDSRVGDIPNLREHFFGRIVDRKEMDTQEFLSLFRGMLKNDSISRSKSKKILIDIISEIRDFEKGSFQLEPEENLPVKSVGVDYYSMSKSQLMSEIDSALDSEDYEMAKKLTDILNEVYPEK